MSYREAKEILDEILIIRNGVQEVSENDELKISGLRKQIISLLENTINFYADEGTLDLFRKIHLARAMGTFLCWNITRTPPTTFMLRPVLNSIEDATIDNNSRPSSDLQDDEIDRLEREEFLNVLAFIKNKDPS